VNAGVLVAKLDPTGAVLYALVFGGTMADISIGQAIGLMAGPHFQIDGAWFACLGAMALSATGVLTREHFRQAVDWPVLLFVGAILGMPAMIRQIGVDGELAQALPQLVAWAHGSQVTAFTLLFAIATAARFALSEWVAVPLLTAALVPIAPAIGLHPWVVAFVVLSAANLRSVPYQFSSYLAFWSASDGQLFTHGQVRAFSVVCVLLSLTGILISIPVWRLLGLM